MRNPTKSEFQDEVHRLRRRVQELEAQQQVRSELSESAPLTQETNSALLRDTDATHPAMDCLPCGILECDPNGLIRFGNMTLARMLDYPLDELQGVPFSKLLADSEDPAQWSQGFVSQINRQTAAFDSETDLKTKEGITKTARFDWSLERNQAGQVSTCIAIIAELSQKQTAQKRAFDRACEYFNLTNEMIIAIDADETISLINQSGAALLETEESAIIGKNWFDHFLPVSVREEVRTLFRQLIQGEVKPVEYYENEILTIQGNLKSIAWHNSILRDDTDSIVGTLSVGVDISERKEIQRKLSEKNEMFRQISEHVRELFWVSSPDFTKTIYLSQMYEVIWGRTRQSAYDNPQNWLEGIHPEDREALLSDMEKKAGGDFSSPEFPLCRVVHTDGSVRWILARAFPVYNERQQVIRIVGIVEDITQRKQAEDENRKANAELERRVIERTSELAQKTAQLKAVFNAIPDVVLVIDHAGKILNINSRHKRDIFVSHELSLDQFIWEELPKNVGQQFESAVERVTETKQMETLDYSLDLDGDAIWYRARMLPYQSNEVLVIIEYIHDQKLAEIELIKTHEKLSETQKLAHIGSWEWDLQNDALWWSDEVYRIFGLDQTRFALSYKAVADYILPDDLKLMNHVIEKAIKENEPYNIELRINRSSGEIRHAQAQGFVKKNPQGEGAYLYGTIQDITERYETARKTQEYRDILAHASRLALMGELTAGISHELNQPLTAIANYSSVMKMQIEQGQDVSELVNRIEELSLRSGKIVRRLKSLAERRAQELNLFNIQDSIRSTLQLIKYEIRQKQVEVNVVCDTRNTMVFADRVQIEQVLANLFLNAVEAMADSAFPRVLTITISPAEANMTLIAIRDTGKGVPAEFVGQLFTPFTSNKKDGLGIGLSLSRSLVEASGGKISFKPSKTGALFHITLPASKMH